jgi:hypothetical protein
MDGSVEALVVMAVSALAALAAFAVYRWRQRRRVRRVEGWVEAYLVDRYGKLPAGLHINCSDDTLWPVLVAFDGPGGGPRHRLQFACPGPDATCSLLSEEEDAPGSAALSG